MSDSERPPELPPELETGDFLASMSDENFLIPDDKLVYQDSFFAFLDILGYKALIDTLGEEAPRYIYKIVAETYKFHRSSYTSVKVKILSDSILIWSTTAHPVGFWNVLNVAHLLRGSFLKKGLLIRGGISYGQNFIHSDIIISPALISAYQLEQKAHFPRIVVDQSALDAGTVGFRRTIDGRQWGLLVGGFFRSCEIDHIRPDKDGVLRMHFFLGVSGVHCLKHGIPSWHFAGDAPLSPEQIQAVKDDGIRELSIVRDDILKALPQNLTLKTAEKYNYVVLEFNELIDELNINDKLEKLDLASVTIP